MHASQLLVAWLAVLALPSAAAQPAAEQAVGPATSPARAPGAFQQPLKVGVGLLSVDNFPFSQKTANASAPDNHAGLEGFEVALMDALCAKANLTCTAVPLYSLEDRLQGVANGTLDLTISSLSFTPGREAVAHFVRPFYYESGVALFADSSRGGLALFGPGSKPGSAVEGSPGGWRGVFTGDFPVGQTICFVEGYYALPFILQEYQINIDLSATLEEAAAKVKSGRCSALAYDSVTPTQAVGLPMLAAPPVFVAPYGVAINRDRTGGELEQRLVWALTSVMNQGNASEILALEQQWLVPNGVGPNSDLQTVVNAISTFAAPLATGPGKVPESYRLFGVSPGGRRLRRW
ncbi:hypothetical protein COHA_008157 [Chlorella ohadii]|uniref:Solute-binding protein family 3/N-terminal domain-containing protein n=1 Tax=Chlorella ohadii TaxID=2649997 RepID=A0AAD5DKJ5_9CHLO|nr:hypothetical protein COHA_008157 [Chlorella ohadii]